MSTECGSIRKSIPGHTFSMLQKPASFTVSIRSRSFARNWQTAEVKHFHFVKLCASGIPNNSAMDSWPYRVEVVLQV